MTKTELIAAMAEKTGATKKDSEAALAAVIEVITGALKAGDKVSAGDVIGRIDTIDDMTQLHFQIWQGTKPQNPELWLR